MSTFLIKSNDFMILITCFGILSCFMNKKKKMEMGHFSEGFIPLPNYKKFALKGEFNRSLLAHKGQTNRKGINIKSFILNVSCFFITQENL